MNDINKVIEQAWPKSALAEMLPYESWEMLPGEKTSAFSAFCSYRDFGADRNILKAISSIYKDENVRKKKYGQWRNWAAQYQWRERAADYDKYLESLKQTEVRKTIEAQGEKHRQVTGKMLDVVNKKLDLMNPEDLTQGSVTEWVQTAVKVQREDGGIVPSNGKAENNKQGELNFVSDFQGL